MTKTPIKISLLLKNSDLLFKNSLFLITLKSTIKINYSSKKNSILVFFKNFLSFFFFLEFLSLSHPSMLSGSRIYLKSQKYPILLSTIFSNIDNDGKTFITPSFDKKEEEINKKEEEEVDENLLLTPFSRKDFWSIFLLNSHFSKALTFIIYLKWHQFTK